MQEENQVVTDTSREPPAIHPGPDINEARRTALTPISFIVGFALNFLFNWSSQPGPWTLEDVLILLGLFTGIPLITIALNQLLLPLATTAERYHTAIRLFVIGMVIIVGSVFFSVIVGLPFVRPYL